MSNSLLQLIEPEAYHHAIAQEVELQSDYPPDPSPDQMYAKGFRDGFGGHEQDKRFTWSLDYMAGYNNGICENFLANPDTCSLPCLTHQEGQQLEGCIDFS